MVKCTPRLIKITIMFFVRPFLGDPRNTALTFIVATNVCVIGALVGSTVKPPKDQRVRFGRSFSDNSYPQFDSVLFVQKEYLHIKNT
jgi:hypothetical protein